MGEEGVDQKREKVVAFFKSIASGGKDEAAHHAQQGRQADDGAQANIQELVQFFHAYKKYAWVIGLIILLILGWQLRTANLENTAAGINGLVDITTGKHVSVDLDSHVFFRLAKYIVENGTLFAHDPLRYYPVEYDPYPIAPMAYVIAYLYRAWALFDHSLTIEYADIMYPVLSFLISLVFFVLLVRRLFNFRIGLLAGLLLTVLPVYLFRTMAGSSDHDAMGLMMMFVAFYFAVRAWQQQRLLPAAGWGVLAGLATAVLGMTWPGGAFPVYVIISLVTISDIMLNKFDTKDFFVYWAWFLPVFLILFNAYGGAFLSTGFLIDSAIGLLLLFAGGASLISILLLKSNLFGMRSKADALIPRGVLVIGMLLVLGIVFVSLVRGPWVISEQFSYIKSNLLNPFANSRWQITVAEQHQPYVVDWRSQMGGNWLFIMLFLTGAVLLFYELVKPLKKRVLVLTGIFALFLLAFIFSRHSEGHPFLNGTSGTAIFLYIGSLVLFLAVIIGGYIYSFYKDKDTYQRIHLLDRRYLFVFLWFFLMVVGARGAIRLLVPFSPVAAVLAAYGIAVIISYGWNIRKKIADKVYRSLVYAALFVFILLIAAPFTLPMRGEKGLVFDLYDETKGQARWVGPAYNQQWQLAGQWIRENTPADSVFAHWWDYGYWVQSGGERATITDGGNEIGPWNYLMGRMVLTGQNQTEALQFLKAHDASHLLIIADEIGKYTAYSSIGSDTQYDRYSWMTLFHLDQTQTQETRDETILFFRGGQPIDEDFIFAGVTFRKQASAVGAVLLPIQQNGEGQVTFSQPTAIVVAYNQQYRVPVNCIFFQDQVVQFEGGWPGCLRIVPSLSGEQQNPLGAAYLISARAMRTLWVNLFMLNQKNPDYDTSAFEPAYDDSRSWPLAVINGRAIGPLRIWKVNYGNFTISDDLRALYISREYVNPDAIII